MHLSFIADTCAHQMYVTKTYTRLKHSLCFIIVLHRVQEDGTMGSILQRMDYLIKRVFSKRNRPTYLPALAIEQANQEV